MNDLQQLVGLVLPEQVSWWPLAIGWYFIIVLIVLLIALLIYKKRKLYIKNSYRRNALQQLHSLPLEQASQLFSILQHTLVHGINKPIELQEKVFLIALNQGHHDLSFNQQDWLLLNKFTYQQAVKSSHLESEFNALKTKCQQWIKEHDYEHHA